MTEALFYHLQGRPLEAVLPSLLERCLERGWRVVVQASSDERIEALDGHLWTYRDESFLPHGVAGGHDSAEQPILLTTGPDNSNRATVRFLVDGSAFPQDADAYARLVLIFDGEDPDALAAARVEWQKAKALNLEATYWQQTPEGRWERKA